MGDRLFDVYRPFWTVEARHGEDGEWISVGEIKLGNPEFEESPFRFSYYGNRVLFFQHVAEDGELKPSLLQRARGLLSF